MVVLKWFSESHAGIGDLLQLLDDPCLYHGSHHTTMRVSENLPPDPLFITFMQYQRRRSIAPFQFSYIIIVIFGFISFNIIQCVFFGYDISPYYFL